MEEDDVEKMFRASRVVDRAIRAVSRARDLVEVARQSTRQAQVVTAAESLELAEKELYVADAYTRTEKAGALVRAAVKMSLAVGEAGLGVLQKDALDLVEEAAEVVRLASEYRRGCLPFPRGERCGWLRRLTCSSRTPPRACSINNQVDSIGLALSSSLNLLPYMGRDGILKAAAAGAAAYAQNTLLLPVYPDAYLWWLSLLFSTWWGLVALGIPVSMDGGCRFLVEYAQLSRHVATLGMSILVCFYCYWMLTPKSFWMLILLCAFFTVVHVVLFIRSYWRRDTR